MRNTWTKRLAAVISAILIISLSASIAWTMNNEAHKLPLRQYFNVAYTNAVWDWTNPVNRSDAELDQLADYLYLHQLNTVYVDTTSYTDTLLITDPARQTTRKTELIKAFERYIAAANKRGIKVYASAGHTDWSKPEQRHTPLAILAFVHDYNRQHQAKIAGMEFDIESYNQTGFPAASFTEKELVLNEYLELIDQLASAQTAYINQTGDQAMSLGFAVPYWFDNENGNIRSVTWHNKTGPTIYHVLDRLQALPNANIVVMAYRNAASGNDGVVAHSRTEVEYAATKTPHVKVIIGQETGNVEPAKITYYGQTTTQLSSEARSIYDQLGPTGALGGIAINDLKSYQELGKNE